MAQCVMCKKQGLFFNVDPNGLCKKCGSSARHTEPEHSKVFSDSEPAETSEQGKNEAMAQEKVSRGELIMALMGFTTTATYNQLMVYTMAMMKVLEEEAIITKDESRLRSPSSPRARKRRALTSKQRPKWR